MILLIRVRHKVFFLYKTHYFTFFGTSQIYSQTACFHGYRRINLITNTVKIYAESVAIYRIPSVRNFLLNFFFHRKMNVKFLYEAMNKSRKTSSKFKNIWMFLKFYFQTIFFKFWLTFAIFYKLSIFVISFISPILLTINSNVEILSLDLEIYFLWFHKTK